MEIPTKFKEVLVDINEKKVSEIETEINNLNLKINEINARIEYLQNVKSVIKVNQSNDFNSDTGQPEKSRRPIKVTFV